MTRFETSLDIATQPERAWAVLADLERWPEWTASTTRLERLDPGALEAGKRVRVEQPKLRPAVFTITDWQPGHSFAWTMGGALLGAHSEHVLVPVAAGSRLELRLEYTGLLGPIVAMAYRGLTRRYMDMEAEGLRARAEGRR